ncbi:MAG: hypothetical protein SP1CHLAM54_05640 [Chlamydiia bacterium]|nr:hypothetical protein [Chlamydiia bacterium]MCH9615474.1 hypothetical protein [Chlamydiia bacterium]MCH9629129.1 hypothetical protein [Chlamydiia bacterium]
MRLEELSVQATQLAADCQAVVHGIRGEDPSRYTKEARIKTRTMVRKYFDALEVAFKQAQDSGSRWFCLSSTSVRKAKVVEAMTALVAFASRCLLYVEAFVAGHKNPGDVISEETRVLLPLKPKEGKHGREIRTLYEAMLKTPGLHNIEIQTALVDLSLKMKRGFAERVQTIYNDLFVKGSPKFSPLSVFDCAEQLVHANGLALAVQMAIDE